MTADSRLDAIRAALTGVIDPETGQDLVAMGMIYDITLQGDLARVTMTTTTPGCPLAGMLRAGVQAAVVTLPGIEQAEVLLTWQPPWTPDRIGKGIGFPRPAGG